MAPDPQTLKDDTSVYCHVPLKLMPDVKFYARFAHICVFCVCSCWLSLEGGLLYAFVGPAAAVVLVILHFIYLQSFTSLNYTH